LRKYTFQASDLVQRTYNNIGLSNIQPF